jgi:hypothetical protein
MDLARHGLVDPTDPALSRPATSRSTAAAGDLAGAEVAFLWNGKSNGDVLLSAFERLLVAAHDIRSLGVRAKLLPNTTAPEEIITGISAQASLVFTGPGD